MITILIIVLLLILLGGGGGYYAHDRYGGAGLGGVLGLVLLVLLVLWLLERSVWGQCRTYDSLAIHTRRSPFPATAGSGSLLRIFSSTPRVADGLRRET